MKPSHRWLTGSFLAGVAGLALLVGAVHAPHLTPLRRLAPADFRKPQIASIVYLGGHGLPTGTMRALAGMHATEVYLYVAYYSDAYFNIPKNPYGMAEPANSLPAAISTLHEKGIRVIAVISSALLDMRQVPPAGRRILEAPYRSVIDPLRGQAFTLSLVRSLLRYPIDGIYVGEPFWLPGVKESPQEREAFDTLYRRIIPLARGAHVPTYMVLPSTIVNAAGQNASGLPKNFAALPFVSLGLDGEQGWDSPNIAHNRRYFDLLLTRLRGFAEGRPMTMELNLKKPYSPGYAPPIFLRYEVMQAKKQGVKTLLLFANEFWAASPYKTQYSEIFRAFLAPQK